MTKHFWRTVCPGRVHFTSPVNRQSQVLRQCQSRQSKLFKRKFLSFSFVIQCCKRRSIINRPFIIFLDIFHALVTYIMSVQSLCVQWMAFIGVAKRLGKKKSGSQKVSQTNESFLILFIISCRSTIQWMTSVRWVISKEYCLKKVKEVIQYSSWERSRTHEIYQFISGVDVAKGETHLTQKGTWLEF